ncbi:MAG: YihY/virulence factor BrkB family protein [Burkholderiaceae bacterium]|nr:YihY/virulence factor BrkB family protein [Burkholderiaceae bacterium]
MATTLARDDQAPPAGGAEMATRPVRATRLVRGVVRQVRRDRLSIVAAGVAFYGLLAVFPAIAAVVAVYGLLLDPAHIGQQVAALSGLLPQQALDVLLVQMQGLVQADRRSLGWGAAGGLLLTLWSASKGVRILIEALNIAYDEREERGFLRRQLLVLLLTLAGVCAVVMAIAAVAVLPAVLRFLGLSGVLEGVIRYARWPVMAVLVVGGLAVMYRYGPSRQRPDWSAVRWGAIAAAVLWLGGSALFSLYVSNFGNLDRTYGSVAAIVVLLMWFLVSAYSVLLGAELNAELERSPHERA